MSAALTLARRLAIVLCLAAVLARPGYGEVAAPTQVADLEVLVVVDRTRSMAALDGTVDGVGERPRIEEAQADLEELVAALPGARFGLLTFGFDVQLELPFSRDTAAFTAAVQTLRLESPTGGIGSSVERPRQEMLDVLTRSHQQYPDRRRIVVFVSDGERTADGAPSSMAQVGRLTDDGVVLGYGTTDGATMPVAADLRELDPEDPGELVIDPRTSEPAISQADPAALRTLADDLGVPFAARPGGAGAADMTALAEGFEASYAIEEGDAAARSAHDLTWVAALALFALVLIEVALGWHAAWSARVALRPRSQSPSRSGSGRRGVA